mgnify:CR=1 FL=1
MTEYEMDCALIAALDIDEDEFTSEPMPFAHYPAFTTELDHWLSSWGYSRTINNIKNGTQIKAGHFELQRHNASVESHVDDVPYPVNFVLAVIQSDDPTHKALSRYDDRNVFTYYHGRAKQSKRLEPGDFVVFNPRKPHGITFYGRRDTLLLASVEPIRKGTRQ